MQLSASKRPGSKSGGKGKKKSGGAGDGRQTSKVRPLKKKLSFEDPYPASGLRRIAAAMLGLQDVRMPPWELLQTLLNRPYLGLCPLRSISPYDHSGTPLFEFFQNGVAGARARDGR